MSKRPTLGTAILVCLLLAALAIGAVACGSGDGAVSTTALPATTTSSAATTTTTAAAGSVTLPSLQMTPELQAYIQQMQVWGVAIQAVPSADDPLSITDVSKVTDAQVKAAEAVATQVHAALDQLKAIKPPAELAAFQESLITLISGGVDATDKAVEALQKKDQAMLDAAIAQGNQLESQLGGLMESLLPLLMGGTPAS